MSSPAQRLTSTGKLVINCLLAIVLYLGLVRMNFPYQWLAGLLCLAVLATVVNHGSFRMPRMPNLPSMPSLPSGALEQGSIKWFNGTKGFGFITGDDGEDVFVHFRNVNGLDKRQIKPGQRVRYRVADSERGPQAEDVTPL